MALEAYRREAEQRYEAGRAALEDALGVLGALAQPASDPAALRAALAQAASLEAVGAGQANAEVGALVDKVQDVLVGVVRAFRGVESWITMSVPKIEDGNNFGCEVQQAVLATFKEKRQRAKQAFEDLAEWRYQRGIALEKFAVEKIHSTATLVAGVEVTEKSKSFSHIEDFRLFVAGLDLKAMYESQDVATKSRDDIAACLDALDKNIDKIRAPKGNANASFAMY